MLNNNQPVCSKEKLSVQARFGVAVNLESNLQLYALRILTHLSRPTISAPSFPAVETLISFKKVQFPFITG